MLSVPLLEAAAERYPNIVLFLADGLPGNLLNEFTMNGRIDIGVLPGNVSATGVTVRPLLRERLALVVAVDSELGQSTDPIGMKRLEGRALVLPESTNRVRQAVDAAFGSIGVVPTVVAEMNSVYSLVAAAVAKLGAAIVPAAAVVSDPRIVTRLLIEPEIERPLHIAYSNAAPLMPTVKAIFDLIIEVTERLVATGQWSAARLGNEGSS
jgi:DNA-binding transcriptional LysR family regulator